MALSTFLTKDQALLLVTNLRLIVHDNPILKPPRDPINRIIPPEVAAWTVSSTPSMRKGVGSSAKS